MYYYIKLVPHVLKYGITEDSITLEYIQCSTRELAELARRKNLEDLEHQLDLFNKCADDRAPYLEQLLGIVKENPVIEAESMPIDNHPI